MFNTMISIGIGLIFKICYPEVRITVFIVLSAKMNVECYL